MAIVGFRCIETGERLSFSDCLKCSQKFYERDVRKNKCFLRPHLILQTIQNILQIRDDWSVTSILSCKRKTFILQKYNVYILPSFSFFTERGKILHQAYETFAFDDISTSYEFPISVAIQEIFPEIPEKIYIRGTIDTLKKINKDEYIIIENKTVARIIREKIPYSSHLEQIMFYEYLCNLRGYKIVSKILYYEDAFNQMVIRLDTPLEAYIERIKKHILDHYNTLKETDLEKIPFPEEEWRCKPVYCIVSNICKKIVSTRPLGEKQQ